MTVRSQNGWTANRRDLMTWFKVRGSSTRFLLRAQYAGPLLVAFSELFNERVEALVEPGCWSYAERPVRGSKRVMSNHASGTAVDLNAPRHPLGRRGTFSPQQAAEIRRLIRLTDGALRWGGDYRLRKDEMHVELNTTDIKLVLRATVALRAEQFRLRHQ